MFTKWSRLFTIGEKKQKFDEMQRHIYAEGNDRYAWFATEYNIIAKIT